MPPICPMNRGTDPFGKESRRIGQAHTEKKCAQYKTRHTSRPSKSDASDAQTQQRDPDKRLTVRDLTLAETSKMEKLEQEKCNHVKPSGSYTEIGTRSEEHTSELQSRGHLVCRLL